MLITNVKTLNADVASFVNIINGAQPAAMGEAYTSRPECIYSLEFNPAGIAFTDSSQFTFSHTEYYSDLKNDYFAFSRGRDRISWAANVKLFSLDDVERDAVGNQTGSFTNRSYQLKLAGAYKLHEKLSVGIGANYYRETIYKTNSSACGIDFGLELANIRINKKNQFNLGISAQNISTKMSFGGNHFKIPEKLRFGGSVVTSGLLNNFLKKTTFAADYVINRYEDNSLNFGMEFAAGRNFSLRCGYIDYMDKDTKSIMTFGGGLGYKFGQLDYAYRNHRDLDSTHTFTFTVNF